MNVYQITDKEARLWEMGGVFFAVDIDRVNLDDLVAPYQVGKIVRCEGDPAAAIRVFAPEAPQLGCVAGWISEDEES